MDYCYSGLELAKLELKVVWVAIDFVVVELWKTVLVEFYNLKKMDIDFQNLFVADVIVGGVVGKSK